jgi:fructokinase
VSTKFAGRFSRAGLGPWLRDNLAANGVDISPCVDAPEPATLAVVTLDDRGRASYAFYGPDTADWQWGPDELPDVAQSSTGSSAVSAVHTGSLATIFEPGASVLTAWLAELHREGRVLVSFDPNVRPGLVRDVPAYRERVEAIVASSQVVKASDEDVAFLYPGISLPEAAERWLAAGACLVVMTKGERGAETFHRGAGHASCAPPVVEVLDTIGAGDAFSAGLLAKLAEQGLLSPGALAQASPAQLRDALSQAVAASAFTCTRAGADPPNAAELAAFVGGLGRGMALATTDGPPSD